MGSADPVKPNVLYSWALMRSQARMLDACRRDMQQGNKVLIDSGAFTNYSERRRGCEQPVGLAEYIDACREHFHGRAWQYVVLDVVKRHAETIANHEAMLSAGLRPMPVLVMGAPFDAMPALVEKSAGGWVCVAGGVGTRLPYIAHRYQRAYAASGKRAKIHGLGFSRWPAVFQLPLASIDVSSWESGGRFGTISTYSRTRGFCNTSWRRLRENRETLRYMGRCSVPMDALCDHAKLFGVRGPGTMVTINAYLSFAEHCRAKGLEFFFAVPTVDWREVIDEVASARRPDGTFDYPAARRHREESAA